MTLMQSIWYSRLDADFYGRVTLHFICAIQDAGQFVAEQGRYSTIIEPGNDITTALTLASTAMQNSFGVALTASVSQMAANCVSSIHTPDVISAFQTMIASQAKSLV